MHLVLSVVTYVVQFLLNFAENFAHRLRAWKVRILSLGVKIQNTPSPILTKFFGGRSEHHCNEAQRLTVAPRFSSETLALYKSLAYLLTYLMAHMMHLGEPLYTKSWKCYNPYFDTKSCTTTPILPLKHKNGHQCIFNGNMLGSNHSILFSLKWNSWQNATIKWKWDDRLINVFVKQSVNEIAAISLNSQRVRMSTRSKIVDVVGFVWKKFMQNMVRYWVGFKRSPIRNHM